MNLSGHESRRLREMEERLVVEDPDLASLLSTGLDRPGAPVPFPAGQSPHDSPTTISGTVKAMVIAMFLLLILVCGANLLSPGSPPEGEKSDRQAQQTERQTPQCHTVSMRDPACTDYRRYAPGS